MSPNHSGQHLAVILPSKGSALEVAYRPTPVPGPDELVIEVRSIALNPVDWYQRDFGFPFISYPTVLGSDIAGAVFSVGSSVPTDTFKPGTHVAAFATSFFVKGAPDYGAFQTHVLVPSANVVPLPTGMTFNEACLLPMAVDTAWSGWNTVGLSRDTKYTTADKKGMLIWGGASSVGSAAVQIAKLMGFSVYVTASEKHHEYLKGLGASKVFDYKSEDVVGNIVKAARVGGLTLQMGFHAAGQVKSCIEILQELKGEGTAKLASAPPLSEDAPTAKDFEVKFIMPPIDEEARMEFSHFVFRVWLKKKLDNGEFVPSPRVQLLGRGLESISKGLDELEKGVSGMKLVVEV